MAEQAAFGPPTLGHREFQFLQELIMSTVGIHMPAQKKALVEGRLARRLRAHGLRDYAAYVELLQQADVCAAELEHLINAITTNKTAFFREEHHFDFLRDEVFPTFSGRSLRIWSAGCSTGEEPYSIAMAAREARVAVEIFASDIDTKVLETARAGIYPEERVSGLPANRLRQHFLRGEGAWDGSYRVRPEVQGLISFGRVNLVEGNWPTGAPFDVIFCRNVIIYFNRETQERLFRRFASRLVPGGAMVIGHSENLSWLPELFQATGKTVYRTPGGPPREPAVRPALSAAPLPPIGSAPPPIGNTASSEPKRAVVRIEAGGVHAAKAPTEIRTVLGSCVAVCVYDPALGIGGMNHFMLPSGESTDRPARYGVHAMELLINQVMKLGGERSRLRAKVFGGASVLKGLKAGVDVGRKNAEFIRSFLTAERIPLESEQLGGTNPLEVRFSTDTARARVRTIDNVDVFRREARVAHQTSVPASVPTSDDIESVLF